MKSSIRFLFALTLLFWGLDLQAQRPDPSLEELVTEIQRSEIPILASQLTAKGDVQTAYLWDYLQAVFSSAANAQYLYMRDNNVDLCDIRRGPSQETDEFFISAQEEDDILTLFDNLRTETTRSSNLPVLGEIVDVMSLYFTIAKDVRYTKMEIFEDMTGFDFPYEFYLGYEIPQARNRVGMGMYACLDRLSQILNGQITQPCFGSKKKVDAQLAESLQVFPNPFTEKITIEYNQTSAQPLTLEVYDLRGSLVQRLVDSDQIVGPKSIVWLGTNRSGQVVENGVYLLRMRQEDRIETISIVRSN